MESNFEVATKVEGEKYTFLGSHIVIDLEAAKWSLTELNRLWLESAMDVAPPALGLTRSRTTEQDISWLIVGVLLNEPLHWPMSWCPPIEGVPAELRDQALSVQT
jgi:hypothetical protein